MSKTHKATRPAPKTGARGYASILVHVEPGEASTHRVKIAAELAQDFDARLIGLGATTVDPMVITDRMAGYVATDLVALVHKQVRADLENAQESFRRDAAGVDVEWRSMEDFAGRAIVRTSRAADLIVASSPPEVSAAGKAHPAEVVMNAGRPVLIVPEAAQKLRGKCVVVAWKDTREARRAVTDALPLLVRADEVIVQGVCPDEQLEDTAFQTGDVAEALKRHGIAARANVSSSSKDDVGMELNRIAMLNDADLIVAGAYGHSRLAEWVFGGVTRDLLHKPTRFVLMSH